MHLQTESNHTPIPEGDYMCDEQLVHFNQILVNNRSVLNGHIQGTIKSLRNGNDQTSDIADQASDQESMVLELNQSALYRDNLIKINRALAAIDSGEFGYCGTCGCEIGLRRLNASPASTECVDCASIAEIRSSQLGHK